MKRLCPHIADIYRRELARGNSLTCVQVNYSKTLPAKHIVYFDHPLDVYTTEGKDLKKSVQASSRFDLRSRGYICLKCGCYVLGRLQEDQQEWYEPDRLREPSGNAPEIIATSENIYWTSDETSPLIYPLQRACDDGDPAPEEHPADLRSYYDMGLDAFPDFATYQQDLQRLADALLELYASERKKRGARLTTAAVSNTAPHQWSLCFDDGKGQAPHYIWDKKDMTSTEAEAYGSVSRAFSTCRYGRLHQIGVQKGQVSFTTIPGYEVIYTANGKPPADIQPPAESGLHVNVEKLAEHWYQRTRARI